MDNQKLEKIEDIDELLKDDQSNEEGSEHMHICVGHGIRLSRLDVYLHSRFRHMSRTLIQKLIKEKGVLVNELPAKASQKLNHMDVIDMIVPPKPSKDITPEDIPIDVIYEDDDIIVINKQPDLIVHPARGQKSGTLVNGLVNYSNTLSQAGGDFRPGIVHRLDRNTTGAMVIAKNDAAHCKISKQFELRTTQKTYMAIVHGNPELDADVISQPLGVHPKIRERYAIRHDIGKEAITFYHAEERFKGFSLVKAMPKTGRTHQIRIHLAWLKCPIVADNTYGGKPVYPWQVEMREPDIEEPMLARCGLHAYKLELDHPVTEKRMEFVAELPDDMQNLLDNLRKYRKI